MIRVEESYFITEINIIFVSKLETGAEGALKQIAGVDLGEKIELNRGD